MADSAIPRLLEPPGFRSAAATFDLLDEALLIELLADPATFARKLDGLRPGAWVVIDEAAASSPRC